MLDKSLLHKISSALIHVYQPISIYLFGSQAWGDPTKKSDVDIVVIIEKSNEKPFKRPLRGLKSLRGMNIAKDLLIYTKREFDDLSKSPTTLMNKVKKQGIKLYERV